MLNSFLIRLWQLDPMQLEYPPKTTHELYVMVMPDRGFDPQTGTNGRIEPAPGADFYAHGMGPDPQTFHPSGRLEKADTIIGMSSAYVSADGDQKRGTMSDQLSAITTDGREVVLNKDGGWAYRKGPAEGEEPFTFRQTRWGMSPDQVQAAEEAELLKASEDGLVYKGQLSRFSCLIAYIFAQDCLVRSKYNLLVEHAVSHEYISDFEFLQSVLQKKYGDPVESQQHWLEDRYRDEEEFWGRAVTLGHLVYYDAWNTENTEISLMLRAEDGRIYLEIEYSSTKLEKLENEEQEEEPADLELF
jgi:hypothetical protein